MTNGNPLSPELQAIADLVDENNRAPGRPALQTPAQKTLENRQSERRRVGREWAAEHMPPYMQVGHLETDTLNRLGHYMGDLILLVREENGSMKPAVCEPETGAWFYLDLKNIALLANIVRQSFYLMNQDIRLILQGKSPPEWPV